MDAKTLEFLHRHETPAERRAREQYEQLAESHDRLLAALEAVEWRGSYGRCPSCGCDIEHAGDCQLHAALKGRDA